MVLFFICLNSQGLSYISNNFNIKHTIYNLRGNASRMELPHFNLEWGKRSFKYICAKQWNFILTEVRESNDLNTFKRFLKTYTFKLYIFSCYICIFIYLYVYLFIYLLTYLCMCLRLYYNYHHLSLLLLLFYLSIYLLTYLCMCFKIIL